MPIKRARSKHTKIFINFLGKKQRTLNAEYHPLSEKQQRSLHNRRNRIEREIIKTVGDVPQNRIPHSSRDDYWSIVVKYLDKDLVGRVLKHHPHNWNIRLIKACYTIHEGDCYIKRR